MNKFATNPSKIGMSIFDGFLLNLAESVQGMATRHRTGRPDPGRGTRQKDRPLPRFQTYRQTDSGDCARHRQKPQMPHPIRVGLFFWPRAIFEARQAPARLKAGLTQAQLAEKLGIRQSMVSAITNAVAARIPMLWPGGSVKRSCQRRAPEIWTRKTAMRVNVQWSGKDSGTHNES
jgi:hypothetical protein